MAADRTEILLRGGRFTRLTIREEDLGPQEKLLKEFVGQSSFPFLVDLPFKLGYVGGLNVISNINFLFNGPSGTSPTAIVQLPFLDCCTGYRAIGENGAFLSKNAKKEKIAGWLPIWGAPFENEAGYIEELFSVFLPLPRLFLIIGMDLERLAANGNIRENTKLVYFPKVGEGTKKPPFPNIYGNGAVCMGGTYMETEAPKMLTDKISSIQFVRNTVVSFLSSRGNRDLWDAGMEYCLLLTPEGKLAYPHLFYKGPPTTGAFSDNVRRSFFRTQEASYSINLAFSSSLSEISEKTSVGKVFNNYDELQKIEGCPC